MCLKSQENGARASKSNICIISGGTATNSLISVFDNLTNVRKISFILPISDNGGSSAEVLRVFGGPAIGDLRSRITKLTSLKDKKTQQTNEQSVRFGLFFNYRLSTDGTKATREWDSIIKGSHPICELLGVNQKLRNFVLFLLVYLNWTIDNIDNSNASKQENFNFQNASIGNLFLVSLRIVFGFNIAQAAEFFLRFVKINRKYSVVPAINSVDKRYNIAAILEDGTYIKGQSQISHPSPKEQKQEQVALLLNGGSTNRLNTPSDIDLSTIDLKDSQLVFQKDHTEPLPSPIEKITYFKKEKGQFHLEHPAMFQKAQDLLSQANVIIYSIGSLMTSIVPVLVLEGAFESIMNMQHSGPKNKVFLLNGNKDRETGDWNALDFIYQIANAYVSSLYINSEANGAKLSPEEEIYKLQGQQQLAKEALETSGINPNTISTTMVTSLGKLLNFKRTYSNHSFLASVAFSEFKDFITHMFILEESDIEANVDIIETILDIKCIKVKTVKEKIGKKSQAQLAHLSVPLPGKRKVVEPVIHYKYDLKDFEEKIADVLNV